MPVGDKMLIVLLSLSINQNECIMEIGTWSNAMAANMDMNGNSSEDEWNSMLPSNISICSRNKCKRGFHSVLCLKLIFFSLLLLF